MGRKKKKKKEVKRRNPYALIASWRSGAGRHPNRKKVANKNACRESVDKDAQ